VRRDSLKHLRVNTILPLKLDFVKLSLAGLVLELSSCWWYLLPIHGDSWGWTWTNHAADCQVLVNVIYPQWMTISARFRSPRELRAPFTVSSPFKLVFYAKAVRSRWDQGKMSRIELAYLMAKAVVCVFKTMPQLQTDEMPSGKLFVLFLYLFRRISMMFSYLLEVINKRLGISLFG
jgi:hypothetical protein